MLLLLLVSNTTYLVSKLIHVSLKKKKKRILTNLGGSLFHHIRTLAKKKSTENHSLGTKTESLTPARIVQRVKISEQPFLLQKPLCFAETHPPAALQDSAAHRSAAIPERAGSDSHTTRCWGVFPRSQGEVLFVTTSVISAKQPLFSASLWRKLVTGK